MLYVGMAMMGMVGVIEAFGAETSIWNLTAYTSWFAEQLPQFRRGADITSKMVCTPNDGDRLFGCRLGSHTVSKFPVKSFD